MSTPVRGVGQIDAKNGEQSGSFEARWGSSGDSLVVIGYAGPSRILDASLLRDSLYIGMRRDDFAVTGRLEPSRGIGADGLRFLLRPWDFSPAWIRDALDRAEIEASGNDWRLRGEGVTSAGAVRFTLQTSPAGEPRRLELTRRDETQPLAVVRYGPLRGFAAGRFPRWVEWERDRVRVRLELRDVDRLPEGRLRVLPGPPRDWSVVGLDDPKGKRFLSRLVGQGAQGTDSGEGSQEGAE